jgi:hypothetical protein
MEAVLLVDREREEIWCMLSRSRSRIYTRAKSASLLCRKLSCVASVREKVARKGPSRLVRDVTVLDRRL